MTNDDNDQVAVVDHLLASPVLTIFAAAAPRQLPELLQSLTSDPELPRLASGSGGVAALQLLADPVTPLSADVAASVEEDHQPWHIFGLEPSASGVKQGLGGSLHAWPNGLLAGTTRGRGHRPLNG